MNPARPNEERMAKMIGKANVKLVYIGESTRWTEKNSGHTLVTLAFLSFG